MLRALAMIAREAKYMESISVCAVKWRAIPCACNPHWAWVSPSVYERTFCSAVKYLLRRIDYAEAENLAQRSWKRNWRPKFAIRLQPLWSVGHGRADSRRVIARIIYISFNVSGNQPGPLVLLFAPLERLNLRRAFQSLFSFSEITRTCGADDQ